MLVGSRSVSTLIKLCPQRSSGSLFIAMLGGFDDIVLHDALEKNGHT